MSAISKSGVLISLMLILVVTVPQGSASISTRRNVVYANYTPSPSMPLTISQSTTATKRGSTEVHALNPQQTEQF